MSDLSRSIALDIQPIVSPLGAAAPPLVVIDSSRYRNNSTVMTAAWEQLPSGIWVINCLGVDNYVSFPFSPNIQYDQIGTLEFWIYYTSGYPISISNPDADTRDEMIWRPDANTMHLDQVNPALDIRSTVPSLLITWEHWVIGSTGAVHYMIKNGVPTAYVVVAGAPAGQWFGDMTRLATQFCLGGVLRGGVLVADAVCKFQGIRYYSGYNPPAADALLHFEAEKRWYGVQ